MRRRDEGSILVLGVGLTVVIASLLTVVVNVAVLWEQRTALNSLADGAALSGAQAVDRAAVFTQGLSAELKLDPIEAQRRVRDYIARTSPGSRLRDVQIERVVVERAAVAVTLSATADPPFGYFMPRQPGRLRSTARGINTLR